MAIAEEQNEKSTITAPAGPTGIPFVSLLGAVLLGAVVVLAGAGGGAYWLVRSGKLPMGAGVATVHAATVPAPPKTHELQLEPLLVNLSDDGGQAYLRVALTLVALDPVEPMAARPKEEKPEKGKGAVIEHNAAIRDAALSTLGRETAAELLAPGGKEHLKTELRAALAREVPELKLQDLYFTEFLVQQ